MISKMVLAKIQYVRDAWTYHSAPGYEVFNEVNLLKTQLPDPPPAALDISVTVMAPTKTWDVVNIADAQRLMNERKVRERREKAIENVIKSADELDW